MEMYVVVWTWWSVGTVLNTRWLFCDSIPDIEGHAGLKNLMISCLRRRLAILLDWLYTFRVDQDPASLRAHRATFEIGKDLVR